MATETQTQKDPVRLQTLLSSLTGYSRQFLGDTERWKVRDEYAAYKDKDGNPIVVKDRTSYVRELLEHQYKLQVSRRGMQLRPVDGRVLDICHRFLVDPTTRTNLLLYGRPGTGKTTFMLAMWMTVGFIYREETSRDQMTIRFIKASELGQLLKNDKDEYRKVKKATCLFIDDLGFNGESEMVNDYGVKARPIEDIIEYRYDHQLMTVCTTNLTANEIRTKYGERIYSRICESFSMCAVTGTDFRQF